MNDNVKKIPMLERFAAQSLVDLDGELIFSKEKFAELIVRECVDICNQMYFDDFPDAEDFERSAEGDAIKKHFGVDK